MQHFVDAAGSFKFPEELFPEVDAPPTVSQMHEKLLNSPKDLAYARDVLHFNDTWSPLPTTVINESMQILKQISNENSPMTPYACYILGAHGIGLPQDEKRTLLRKAIKVSDLTSKEDGHVVNGARAWYKVGLNAEMRGDHKKALSRFERGADRMDAACLYTLALAYLQGQFGVEINVDRALNFLELALATSDADFPRAPYFLGKILLGEANSLGIPSLQNLQIVLDQQRGLNLVERSALMGFSPALLRMADAFLSPTERGFDCCQALRYLSLACAQDVYRRFTQRAPILRGVAESQLVKWLLCGFENKMLKNEQWAYIFAEVGALDQNGSALFALAYFSEVGISTPQDTQKALALYELSSQRGCTAAQTRLEQMGSGLKRTLTRKDHDRVMRTNSVIKGGAVEALQEAKASAASDSATSATSEASETSASVPSARAPSVTPSVSNTAPNVPNVSAPNAPSVSAPSVSTSRVPSVTPSAPSVSAPNLPSVSAPSVPNAPSVSAPTVNTPSTHTPPPATPPLDTLHIRKRPPSVLPYPIDDTDDVPTPAIRQVSLPYPTSPKQAPLQHNNTSMESFKSVGEELEKKPVIKKKPVASSPEPEDTMSLHSSAANSTSSRKSRPLSSEILKNSKGIFSTSTPSLHASVSNSNLSSHTSTSSLDDNRTRSPSPLRKMFGSTPEQRAAASRADRRSFTEAALAELANAPKVPVKPIKEQREPGVAYTFEDMGIETIVASKNGKCLVM